MSVDWRSLRVNDPRGLRSASLLVFPRSSACWLTSDKPKWKQLSAIGRNSLRPCQDASLAFLGRLTDDDLTLPTDSWFIVKLPVPRSKVSPSHR